MAADPALTGSEDGPELHSRMDVLATDPAAPMRPLILAFPDPADRHPAAVYLARLAPGSRRTMRQALDVVASILTSGSATAEGIDWSAVRYQHAQAVRTRLAERYRPASANKALSALRGVLREAWRLGLTSAEEYERAADLEAVHGETLPAGRALSAGELKALLGACAADPGPAGPRDAALFALLYGGGLRRSEAIGLDLADCDLLSGAVTVRRGKGDRERVVYATNGAADALADWMSERGEEPGPLFLPVNKGDAIGTHRLTGQAVAGVLGRRAREGAVAHVRPHDLRRTFVGDLLDAGADISTVQRLAGHASVRRRPGTTGAAKPRRGARRRCSTSRIAGERP